MNLGHITINIKKISTSFVKYFLGSGLAFLCDIGLLFSLTHFFLLHYLLGNVVSYLTGGLVSFALNKKYTFENKYKKHTKQFMIFMILNVFNLAIVSLILFLLVDFLDLYFLWAKTIATGVSFVIGFFAHKHITFRFMK